MSKIFVATRLDVATHNALKALAKRHDRPVAYLLRKAAEGYVKREEKGSKAA